MPASFIVRLHGEDAREVCACARPANDDAELSVAETVVTINVWREGPGVIRGSISHPTTGCSAMFQGNDALDRLAHALCLRLDDSHESRDIEHPVLETPKRSGPHSIVEPHDPDKG
ncbi:MAG TPA: hypothetical protein VHT53_03750 [Candidatus Elarobacter sp.]|nr:hypothetical protein [Candidatus Elarobacter sp.]